jgi:hypothetical protein
MFKLIASTAAVVATAVLAGTAAANPPVHARTQLDITAPSPEYSAACGFAVFLTARGTFDVTVHTNPDGSVREQDVAPGLTITVSAPSTGRSFSHVSGPTTYLYTDGVYEGAPVIITEYGVRGDAPGIPPDAGRIVTPGVIVAIDPDFGPIPLPIGPPLAQSGNFEDHARILAAICAALSA